MAYLVNKTNGELLATILDGQINNTNSSLVLIGKQVTNYGELQNENFVHLMENFANSIDPAAPLAGQLWWDTANNTMQVFDSSTWRPVTGFTSTAAQPVASYVGDQWYDVTNQQFKVYNGTNWLVVGPAYSVLDGKTGAIVENVYDTGATKHTIIKVYHNGNVTAIINRDAEFTPNVAISGFTTVRPGISFTSEVDAIKLYGTATNADTLGNLTPSQFLRSDVTTVGTGRLSIQNQVDIGQNNELNFAVNGLGDVLVKNISLNGDISFSTNAGGSNNTGLTIRGSDSRVLLTDDPIDAFGVSTKQYTDGEVLTLRNQLTDAGDGYITTNVAILNASIVAVQANVTAANAAIASLDSLKAPLNNPALTGVPTAPTAATGTANTQIATTEFVASTVSIFDSTKIYNGSSYVLVNAANISLVASGTSVATVTTSGITTSTQAEGDSSTKVATTAFVSRGDKNYVLNSVKYQPTCYVSDQAPDNGVGSNGDFWFQYS